MSADNGVYILQTNRVPKKEGNCYINRHGEHEFRVAHCQAIDNLDYSDLYMPVLFGRSKVYSTESEANEVAHRIYASLSICEYGIQKIVKDCYFPNITASAAAKALDCYEGAEPLDLPNSYIPPDTLDYPDYLDYHDQPEFDDD